MSSGPRPGQARRQEVVDTLCEAFAHDEMALDEFERRVEAAHRAVSVADLEQLVADLSSKTVAWRAAHVPSASSKGSQSPPGPPDTEPTHARRRDVVVGVMGGAMRRGRWTPARRVTAIAVMGGVELDFRTAALPPGVTEVHAFAFWGGVQILAPPHARIECSGIGILGGFDHREEAGQPSTASSPPVLRITGLACMGGVDVKVRSPGETARQARRRLKENRPDRRLRGGGPEEGA